MSLAKQGAPVDDVLATLSVLRAGDLPTHGGRTWAYVYDSGLAELDSLADTVGEVMQSPRARNFGPVLLGLARVVREFADQSEQRGQEKSTSD